MPAVSAVLSPAVMYTLPPSRVLPGWICTRMSPALPDVAVPVPTEMRPLVPPLAVPELKVKCPLTPLMPALGVQSTASPLDVAVPWPVRTATWPPLEAPAGAVAAVASPANTMTSPPSLVFPEPTVTRMDPALPLVECPVPTEMLPLLPTLAVPELKLKRPDTPLSPEFIVRTVTEPLDVIEP